MKRIVVLTLLCMSLLTSCQTAPRPSAEPPIVEEAAWSEPNNELRGRLHVLPFDEAGSAYRRVYLEFENLHPSISHVKIRYAIEKLTLKVTDGTGEELRDPFRLFSGFTALDESFVLPPSGVLRFSIHHAARDYIPPAGVVIVDAGEGYLWEIPNDGKDYFLSGTFTVKPEKRLERVPVFKDWSGSLELPPAAIPRTR